MLSEAGITQECNRLIAYLERNCVNVKNGDRDSAIEVLRRTMERYIGDMPVEEKGENLEDLLIKYIVAGARAGNPGSQKLMQEIVERQKAKDYMNNLTINIVPFDVEDAKLPDIIAECDIDIFEEMMEAGNKRLAEMAIEAEDDDD